MTSRRRLSGRRPTTVRRGDPDGQRSHAGAARLPSGDDDGPGTDDGLNSVGPIGNPDMYMLQALKARLLAIKLKRQILEVEVSWEWAANQALSGAISGGTGWAVGFALNEIFGPSQPSIGALLQQFAEQFAGMLREQGIRARVTDVNVEVTTLIRNLSSTSGGLSSTQLLREADRASGILSRTSVDDEIRLRVMPSFAIVLPIYVGTLFELARKGPPDNTVTAVAFANDQIGFIRSMLRNVESIYPDWTEDLIQPAHDRVSAEVFV